LVLFALVAAACTPASAPTTTTTTTPIATSTTSSSTSSPTTTTEVAIVTGADGIGDTYYPHLGNGGYDVEHYDLYLHYAPDTNELLAITTIEAVATKNLSRFNLDFVGFDITDLQVNGEAAAFERQEPELIITPAVPLAAGEPFVVQVKYEGQPGTVDSPAFSRVSIGWREGVNGEQYVVAEPDAAHSWFPANDHPLDKATFRFTISVPEPYAAAANGEFFGTEPDHNVGDAIAWTWDMDEPMAPYLATVIIGEGYELVPDPESTAVAGIVVRNFLPPDLVAAPPSALADTGEMIVALEEAFGPYPFDRYGITVVGGFPAALENQTLSVFGRQMVNAPFFEFVLVHELAHQWFGDSVSVGQWSDIWLSEGFATYAELLWVEHLNGQGAYEEVVANRRQAASLAAWPLPGEPPPTDLFNRGVYQLGGLLLADLREEIGDDHFFDLLRTYATEFAGGTALTKDFIALAEEISGQELEAFFDERLYG
jgi:aminopeptidase N